MGSKQQILSSIRSHLPQAVELPRAPEPWIQYADRQAQFAAALASVGGTCIAVRSAGDIDGELSRFAAYSDAKLICSRVPGAGKTNLELDSVNDPHDLEAVDFAILPGEFAVAENGAVWINEARVPHRAIYFIVQHLALVIPAREVVNNMHEAYERLCGTGSNGDDASRFREAGFGTFISGPSKTADIEQSLVIGAHGPRSLVVFLVGDAM